MYSAIYVYVDFRGSWRIHTSIRILLAQFFTAHVRLSSYMDYMRLFSRNLICNIFSLFFNRDQTNLKFGQMSLFDHLCLFWIFEFFFEFLIRQAHFLYLNSLMQNIVHWKWQTVALLSLLKQSAIFSLILFSGSIVNKKTM